MSISSSTRRHFWRIPLKDILEVKASFGVITRIITIQTAAGTFKIRCHNADRFAEEINRQITV